MSFLPDQGRASGAPARLSVVETDHATADRPRLAPIDLEPFVVDVRRRALVTIVQPAGELDLASVDTLHGTLEEAIAETMVEGARLVLDLRGVTFIDSSGLHLLVTLDRRARRDGLQLTMVAPPAPVDTAIRICGLDRALPFVAPVAAVEADAGGREALTDAS